MINANDKLALSVVAVFVTAALVGRAPGDVLLPLLVIAAAIVVVSTLRSRAGRLLHDLSPVAWIIATFEAIGAVIAAVNPKLWDARLDAVDERLFATVTETWMDALGRPAWLTDVASAAYASFYALPIGIALLLYFGGLRREYHPFVFAVALAFFLPFFGYLLMPATGPRLAGAAVAGGPVSAAVQVFLRVVEKNLFDAFPSGHTAVTLVVVARAWVLLPRWRVRVPLATYGALIVFATVYLSLHYVVDVAAGVVVALAVLAGAPRLFAWLSPGGEAAVDVELGARHV